MENAAKALYIAAGVLIGVLIISLAVVVYSSLQSYVEKNHNIIKSYEVEGFNSKYLNYANCVAGSSEINFELTIQDVVTAANSAYENNRKYSTNTDDWEINEKSLYVEVKLDGKRIDKDIDEKMVSLLENNKGTRYLCTTSDVIISDKTGQVYSISFKKLN